jgi:hypothetical protein
MLNRLLQGLAILALLVVMSWCVSGCGLNLDISSDLKVYNTSGWPTELALDVVDAVRQAAAGLPDLDGYSIYLHGTLAESRAACAGSDGCSATTAHYIHVPFIDPASEMLTPERATGLVARLLAHELGHVYYFEHDGDADGTHTHTEWFDYHNQLSMGGAIENMFEARHYEFNPP